jgi:hypothetical protein
MKSYNADHHDTCVRGIATVLWGSAWADHVEEHRCESLSQTNILDVMPEIPPEAWALAERVLGRIEQCNPQWGCNWPSMFAAAMRADSGKPDDYDLEIDYHGTLAQRFGECMAWMAMGAGVSWTDDHKAYELHVPLCAETWVLQILAGEQCKVKR